MKNIILRFVIVALSLAPFFAKGQVVLPENFYNEHLANFQSVCGFTFDENGRIYLWEKKGVVRVIDTNHVVQPDLLIDITEEVGNWRDHGLLGFALDPNFLSNGYYYLWYVVDRHHLLTYGTPQYHPDTTWDYGASIGRLTRYTADAANDFKTTVPNSRKVLVGETKSTGLPILGYYHAGGTILFGEDNTLLLSVGDGATGSELDTGGISDATFGPQALADGIITPDQDIGLYRCQYLGALNGKVLRLDPETGDGISSNPFYDAGNPRSPQSRTWALGLRNPFRMTLVEGTGSHSPADGNPGTLVVGDIGLRSYEEVNIVDQGGLNFGWPIYQGHFENSYSWHDSPYNMLAPNPLHGTNGCNQPYFKFRDLLALPHKTQTTLENPCDNNVLVPNTIHRFKMEPPHISYRNSYYENPPEAYISVYDNDGVHDVINVENTDSWVDAVNFDGECSIGGVFYKEGHFPEKYHGAYFHIDYSGWIKTFYFDSNLQLEKVENFMDSTEYILTAAVHPENSCLYYVGNENKLQRICYGGNPLPKAVIESDVLYGTTPLTVQFDGSNSFDPLNEDIVGYEWDFGDGSTSSDIAPEHTFTTSNSSPTPFEVTLTVSDASGQVASTTMMISLNNTPPNVDIISFENGDLYPSDKSITLPLVADVNDAESDADGLTYEWTTYVHHNTHFHTEPLDTRVNTHTIISPLGCSGEEFYYRIGLSVTDEHGLTTTQEKYIYPNCNDAFVEFLNLQAETAQDSIMLTWESSMEDSVLYFEVEKGKDIWNFQKIGTVEAKGSNSNYNLTDISPFLGVTYYRVKAYRSNQAFDYSNRIAAKFSDSVIEVFPNPSQGIVNIYFADDFENVTVNWYNAQGQLMKQDLFDNIQENQLEQVRLDYANGSYYYTVEADDQKATGRVMIVR